MHNQVADELLQYGRDMDDHENQVRAAMESAMMRTQGRIPATAETFDMTDMESVETMSQADLYEWPVD